MITIIAAIGKNRELGFENTLPWKIPEDMQHFKQYTSGKVVIMGSNTFQSLGHKPLPGRKNIVVTSRPRTAIDVIYAGSVQEALSIEHCYDELVIIGGESIYRQTVDLADKMVITHVDSTFVADTFFPEITNKWSPGLITQGCSGNFNYRIVEYTR